MGTDIHKCGIVGCGFVGATTAFALVESGLFPEIVLLDANKQKAMGEAMDLNHSIPFARPVKVYAGDYDDLSGCALIIIAAGVGQRPGESRIALLNRNVGVFREIIPEITKRNPECVLLVVTNPVDILTYVSLKLSGFPENRVIGSGTVLDTARLKYLLGQHLGVDSRHVHAFIVGEHGDSELAVWSSANVSGIDLRDFCQSCANCGGMEEMRRIYEEVRGSAYEIIKNKGATYYAIAMAVRRIAEAIVRDEHSILCVSGLVRGYCGIENVCLGLPAVVGRGGIERMLDLRLDAEEEKELLRSAEKLRRLLEELSI